MDDDKTKTYPKELLYEAVPPPPQLTGESDVWYNRFVDYYLLQVPAFRQTRNLTRAYRLWRMDQAVKQKIDDQLRAQKGKKKREIPPEEELKPISKSEMNRMSRSGGNPIWKKISMDFRWIERVGVWDHQYAVWERTRWFARQQEARERQWELGRKMTTKGEEIISQPLHEEITRSDGKTIIKKPGRWEFGDAVSFINSGLDHQVQASHQEQSSDILNVIDSMEKSGMITIEGVVQVSELFDQFTEQVNKIVRQNLVEQKESTYDNILPVLDTESYEEE